MSIKRKEIPAWAFPFGRRADQAEDPVCVLGQRRPRLLAVDDVVIAFPNGPGLQRSEVRAGSGLGIALAPPVLHRDDAWQESLLLRRAPELHDHRRDHLRPEGNGSRATGEGGLFVEDVELERVPARAAELDGPGRSAPPLGMKDLLPANVVVTMEVTAAVNLFANVRREFLGQECAYVFPK